MKAKGITQAVRDIVHARSGYVCEKCGKRRAEQIHHRTGRQMGGSREPWVNLPGNLLDLCTPCHDEVTNTRGLRPSHETFGWLVRRGTKLPVEVPVVLHHGLVLLDDEGGYMPALEVAR